MLSWSDTLTVTLVALTVDAVFGDPDRLWRRLAHPVAIIGGAIAALDRALNRETWPSARRRLAGIATMLLLVAVSVLLGCSLEWMIPRGLDGNIALGLLASTLIAQKSLYQHVARVHGALRDGGLDTAREAVSHIVGRNPESLDESGVARAAIESCAENFSDGVVVPVFWLALLGLPGLIVYKAINTADSMIGHRTPRHRDFGWAAARLDDLFNLVPARLAGVLIALVAPVGGGSIVTSFKTMRRDARQHRSPNAGWPEGAMAGALGIALAGPRRYGDTIVDDPFLNAEGRKDAMPDHIRRALKILVAACALEFAVYAALSLL
jgi:adenosylcobinamide-phosphate synthase